MAFSADSRRIVSLTHHRTNDGRAVGTTVRIWDSVSGALISQANRASYTWSTPVFADGGRAISFVEDPLSGPPSRSGVNQLVTLDAETARVLREESAQDMHTQEMAASPDGRWLANALGWRVSIWNRSRGELECSLVGLPSEAEISGIVFSPDSSMVAACVDGWLGDTPFVCVWRLSDGEVIHKFSVAATALAFPNGNRSLVSAQRDGTLMVWDLTTVQPKREQVLLSTAELERRWHALRETAVREVGGGYDLMRRNDQLVEGGDQTIAFLAPLLFDLDLANREDASVDRLIAPLSSPNVDERVRAAEATCAYTWTTGTTVDEVRNAPPPAKSMMLLRHFLVERLKLRRDSAALEILERIGTPAAHALLKRLADELPDDAANRDRKKHAREYLEKLEQLRLRGPGLYHD